MTEKDAFVITRTFNAPRDLVFKVYSEEEHLKNWWGPKGFEWVKCKLDFRPEGIFHYCMKAPNGGGEMWGKFVYKEIVAPEKIVFVNSFSDENAGITRHPMAPSWPAEVFNVVTFTETDGKTTIHMEGHPINAKEEEVKLFMSSFDNMNQGFKGTLDQLEAYLEKVKK